MIKENTTVSMSEALKYLGKDEKHTELKGFIKKFVKLSPSDAEKLRKDIKNLELMKVKQEHIAKIIDFVPEKAEDLNKIFNDINLEEDEITKILSEVKKYL
jgi:DNA-directed RNA polymerase subunit F